jgi:hypothetical protein
MKDTEYVDIILKQVDGYGFLPIIKLCKMNKFDEEEVYRGEFHQTIDDAMNVMRDRLSQLNISWEGGK